MPSAARKLWEGWRHIAKRIGDFQARVLLAVFYFVLFWPFALAVRWGSDPLAIKANAPRGWRPKATGEGPAMDQAQRQF